MKRTANIAEAGRQSTGQGRFWENGGGTHLLWLVTVLLRYGAVNWIYVTEYKVHFHIVAALVRSKHNGVGCLVIELQHNARMIIVRQTINILVYHISILGASQLSQLTVVRSSVSLPADSSLMYEPPHS